jgi:hypothetical protein
LKNQEEKAGCSSGKNPNEKTKSNDGKESMMSKSTIAGLLSWFVSGLLLGYQALAGFIKSGGTILWKNITLMDVVGKSRLNWIEGISPGSLHLVLHYIVTQQLYILLFFVGIFFFIISRLTSKL